VFKEVVACCSECPPPGKVFRNGMLRNKRYPSRIFCGIQRSYSQGSVVQLLLTSGAFYQNVTTYGALPTTWCTKQQIHKIWN